MTSSDGPFVNRQIPLPVFESNADSDNLIPKDNHVSKICFGPFVDREIPLPVFRIKTRNRRTLFPKDNHVSKMRF